MLRPRDIARVLIRFFGLLILLQAVISLPAAIEAFSVAQSEFYKPISGNTNTEALIALTVRIFAEPCVYFVVGVGVIWSARRVVEGAAAKRSPGDDASLELAVIEAILIAVLGVYFLCDGFVDLVATAGLVSFRVMAGGVSWATESGRYLVSYGVGILKLGIGIVLILRRQGVVTLRSRIPEWTSSARRWKPFQSTTQD